MYLSIDRYECTVGVMRYFFHICQLHILLNINVNAAYLYGALKIM